MRVSIILLLACGLVGCGTNAASMPPPDTVVVTGKAVNAGGQPIASARIRFSPAEGAAGAESYAETAADGSFKLQSFGGRDGVMPGYYRVCVMGRNLTSVSPQCQTPETTPIKMEIKTSTTDVGVIRFQ